MARATLHSACMVETNPSEVMATYRCGHVPVGATAIVMDALDPHPFASECPQCRYPDSGQSNSQFVLALSRPIDSNLEGLGEAPLPSAPVRELAAPRQNEDSRARKRIGSFKQTDVTRALRGAVAAGLDPSAYRIDWNGGIIVMFGNQETNKSNNPWDEELPL
jgi:hypothetical protein